MKIFYGILVFCLAIQAAVWLTPPLARATGTATVQLQAGSATLGGVSTMNMTIDTSQVTTGVAGVQWDFIYNAPDITAVTVTDGAVVSSAGKNTACNQVSAGDYRCVVYGMNQNTINSGVLSVLGFTIASSTSANSIPIQFSNLSAVDPNGVEVALNGTGSAITVSGSGDVIAPSVPANVTATAVSFSQVNLSWDASTDNVGVVGYKIFRGGALISSVSGTTYSDINLAPATLYSYTIAAYDAAGNISAQSAPASVTTPASTSPPSGGPPSSPVPPAGRLANSITNFQIVATNGVPTLSWINPDATSGWVATVIIRKQGSTPPTSISDGQQVFSGQGLVFTDTGASGTQYSYAAFAKLSNGTYLAPVTTSSSSASANSRGCSFCLVNDSGTFYVISQNIRHGITSPGILFSYGYDWSDAFTANAGDRALPLGSLLLPGEGALVKTSADPTVYLISGNSKHGFVSFSVFKGLGFKTSSVLVVTAPELNQLPAGNLLSNTTDSHLPGLDINVNGTIYWIDSSGRHAYPSLDVYNSWHHDNDFSWVVPANAADLAYPIGAIITKRILAR